MAHYRQCHRVQRWSPRCSFPRSFRLTGSHWRRCRYLRFLPAFAKAFCASFADFGTKFWPFWRKENIVWKWLKRSHFATLRAKQVTFIFKSKDIWIFAPESTFRSNQFRHENSISNSFIDNWKETFRGFLYTVIWLKCRQLTWVSDRFSADANSTRSGVDRYRCASNLRSNPHNCWSENTVRALRLRHCFVDSAENKDEKGMPVK